MGWTIAQVHDVYPAVTEDSLWNGMRDVPVPANTSASYRLQFTDGKLSGITLQNNDHGCYN